MVRPQEAGARSPQVSIFDHNCENAECLSRRVVSMQTVKTPEGWTLVTAVCADCGQTTRYDTKSDYRFVFACSPTGEPSQAGWQHADCVLWAAPAGA